MSDPVVSLDWPEEEDSLAATISELEHDLRSGGFDTAVVLARLGQIRDRAVMEEQASARQAEDFAEERDLRAVTREKLAEVVARAEKAEAEVARLTAKLAQLPLDIADTLLAQRDYVANRFADIRVRLYPGDRVGGLEEAAEIVRRFAKTEVPDAT